MLKRFRSKANTTDESVSASEVERLGEVVLASAALVVIDFGLLGDWSHHEPPRGHFGDPELDASVEAASDLEIVGPDAVAVSSRLDLASSRGTFVFDVPPDGAGAVRSKVEAICRDAGFEAAVEEIPRMPHGERVRQLLRQHPDGVEVPFAGPSAVAVDGFPTGRPFEVFGTRMPADSPDAGRWRSVWLEVEPGRPVRQSVQVGHVLVDAARLMFCDAEALGAWNHDEPSDGLFDVVFWGRDAERVAASMDAPLQQASGDRTYGWVDIEEDGARNVWRQLSKLRDGGEAKFAFDVRPHSDHYRLLAAARNTPTESAGLDVGDGRVVGFFTSWGDGAFPVFRDLDDAGSLVRVRVELGCDAIVTRTRRFELLWFGELSHLAFVSARVARDGLPIGYMYREPTDRENHSGWCLLAGNETDEYLDDAQNVVLMPLRDVIASAPDIEKLLSVLAPVAFRRGDGGDFVVCPMPEPRA